MSKSPGELPPKLLAVFIRLGRSVNLNVTQAVKLPYLVDVVATHFLGAPITEGTHQGWDKGVVTSQVWHYLTKCEEPSVFHLEPVPWSEERRVVIHAETDGVELTPEQEQVIDIVVKLYSGMSASELGRLTKFMNPEISAWGSNREASLKSDAYDRMSEEYQAMAKMASLVTLDQLKEDWEPVMSIEDAVA